MTQSGYSPEEHRPSPPTDDPFLERLFGVMCENIPAPTGRTFVDQVHRWYGVLRFMADLQPRTNSECLLAADVSMKHEFMQDVLARGKGPAGRQRARQSREFIACTEEFQSAQREYDLLRSKLTG
jgi:hypothetical protein